MGHETDIRGGEEGVWMETEIRVMWPHAQGHSQPSAAGSDKEWDLLRVSVETQSS